MHSLSGLDGASTATFVSPRDTNHANGDVSVQHVLSPKHPEESSNGSSAHNSVGGAAKSSVPPPASDFKLKSDEAQSGTTPVFLDKISSSAGEMTGGDDILDNCGLLPNNCLPCLASTVHTDEKRRSLTSSPRKKAALKLPFKWKDGHPAAALCEY